MQRQEYTLLYTAEENEHWIAIFRLPNSKMAIYMRTLNKEYSPLRGSLSIETKDGEVFFQEDMQIDVLVPDGPLIRTLYRSEGFSFAVRQDYEGDIFITYSARTTGGNGESPKNVFTLGHGGILIFDLRIPWNVMK